MDKLKVGDRVWVVEPARPEERKVGTIMSVKGTGQKTRYGLEWETDLSETKGNRSTYLGRQLRRAGKAL